MTMQIMTDSSLKGQVAQPFKVGDIVSNFGAVVRIHAIDEQHGLLVSIIPWVRDGVKQGGVGQNYFAKPSFCQLVRAGADEVEALDRVPCSFCDGTGHNCPTCD